MEKYSTLSAYLDKFINDANLENSNLQNKLTSMPLEFFTEIPTDS